MSQQRLTDAQLTAEIHASVSICMASVLVSALKLIAVAKPDLTPPQQLVFLNEIMGVWEWQGIAEDLANQVLAEIPHSGTA